MGWGRHPLGRRVAQTTPVAGIAARAEVPERATSWKSPVAIDARLDNVIPLASSLDRKLPRSSPIPLRIGPRGPAVRLKPGVKLPRLMGPIKSVRVGKPPRNVVKRLGLNPPRSEPKPPKSPPRLLKPPVMLPRSPPNPPNKRAAVAPPRSPPRSPPDPPRIGSAAAVAAPEPTAVGITSVRRFCSALATSVVRYASALSFIKLTNSL